MAGVGRRAFLTAILAGAATTACGSGEPFFSPPRLSRLPPNQPPPLDGPAAGLRSFPAQVAAHSVLDDHLLVGYCGAPGSPALGRMTGDLQAASAQLRELIATYPRGRPVVPVVELIATTVNSAPGPDGMYRSRASDDTIRRYLEAARAMDGQLLLDIQPGRADFLPEVQAFERWLTEPDVGVALDPEWAVEPGVEPGEEFGRTTGEELDGVATYLASLVARHGLPEKIMVYHQVAVSVVEDIAGLKRHSGVAVVNVVDGIGSAGAKKATWDMVMKRRPPHVNAGFKLFYQEDTRGGQALMQPEEVLALNPEPVYVVYE
ncbi:hypothetical protein GCM10027445_37590 [Amycolatopsis endophytica]|uniref:Lipoprotein n=1 Tax=Amycolatopsis endophytica TaxID=860233 RepID=A0A853B6S8_9PSEU|nr:hypothetical protein [Amycolatopsis endophytica]NYI90968.1 hypothetical protein [Amycolatopsis endophytica]